MASRLKLGELIDSTLSAREQARILTRMQDTVRGELDRQRATEAKSRARRRSAKPDSALAARVKKRQQVKLIATLELGTDATVLRRARAELATQLLNAQPTTDTPPATAQALTSRLGAIVAHHSGGTAPYWAKLGPAPDCAPGDTTTAMVFYRKVCKLIEAGGWTNSERAALRDLANKWGPRAHGRDARFMIVGTMPGRLPKDVEAKIKQLRESLAT